ncbi:MAG: D-alanyl-D-alanine carboxypeptidase/D-alanyl-D-alanine-endopeptidase [Xenococcaceae cyanobacterium]
MLNLFIKLGQPICVLLLFLGVQVLTQKAFAEPVPTPPTVEKSLDGSRHICPADLSAAIEAVTSRPEFERSRWGILIQTLTSEHTLYALDAERYFIPASNLKLLTTAAALRELGAQFRIRTSVYGTGTIPNLTSLRLVGRGDPSLTTVQLKDLAQQLKRQGVRRISQLIVEDSYFKELGINPTWEWEDIYYYYAVSVNSLILNENAVILTLLPQQLGQSVQLNWSDPIAARQWRVKNQGITAPEGIPYGVEINGVLGQPVLKIKGELAIDSEPDIWGLAVVDPANYFLESFRRILLAEGIAVTQGFVTTSPQEIQLEVELAAVESSPLAVLLQKTNQESNNLFAETLMQILGSESTTETGLDVIKKSLTELGVDPESYILADGSGLSRHNLVSPEAVVQTLRLMAKIPEAEIYRESLPIAGVSGTLRRRFQDTPLQGNLQAKTGTLTGVSALSGYLDVPDYQPLVFSIMVNQSEQSVATLHEAIDEIVLLLRSLRSC